MFNKRKYSFFNAIQNTPDKVALSKYSHSYSSGLGFCLCPEAQMIT